MSTSSGSENLFLALTGNDDFWDKSKSLLFLSEWCKNPAKKNIWKNLNSSVLQSNYLNYENSYQAYQYAFNTYEKLLPKISNWLNRLHSKNYSLKYWRLMVGPFLLWYTQIIHERFIHLQAAYQEYPNIETIGLDKNYYLTPTNTSELICLAFYSDNWNLQIFTQLLDIAFKRPIQYKETSWVKELTQRQLNYVDVSYKIRTKLLTRCLRFINKLNLFQSVGLLGGLSKSDMMKLMLNSGFRILPILPQEPINRGQILEPNTLSRNINFATRSQLLEINTDDQLSSLVMQTLQVNMPSIFIEGYNQEEAASKKYFPYTSKVIFIDQAASNDQYKFWIGEQIEKGAKLVNYQHGGCYGMQKASIPELLERQVSDCFISWGWGFSENVSPIGMPLHKTFKKYYKKDLPKENKIVWVTTLSTRYNVAICDWVISDRRPYLEIQKKFFREIARNIVPQLCMRLDPATNHIDEIKNNLPGLNIILPNDRGDFFDQLATAKLMILDNPSTALLYTLAFNTPTILFWDKNHWQFREEAVNYLDELEDAGIYYSNPEDAARMVNKISDDPGSWWNNKIIQEIRERFANNFARISPNYIREIKGRLLSLGKMNFSMSIGG